MPAPPPSTPALGLVFHADPLANLVYQLDAMAGLLRTPPAVFRAGWEADLGWTERDDAELARWRRVQDRYRRAIPTGAEEPWVADLPPPQEDEIELAKKLRLAALDARDPDDYAARLALVATPRDARALAGIAAHFFPRFRASWDRELAGYAAGLIAGFAALVEDRGLLRLTEQVARFHGADLPGARTLHVHLVLRTDRGGRGLQGEQVEGRSIIELFPSQAPRERIDVVLHELFHHLFWSAPRARHLALVQAFARADEPHAIAAYHLLDESLAAALGNGLVARAVMDPDAFAAYFARPGALYDHDAVDRLARALVPEIDAALASGAVLDARFVAPYLRTAERALGSDLGRLDVLLSTMALGHDGERASPAPARALVAAMRARSVYGRSPATGAGTRALFERYGQLSGALVALSRDADGLSTWTPVLGAEAVSAIRRLAAERPGFVYGVRRSPRAWIFVVMGRDEAAQMAAVRAFAAAPGPFVGRLGA